MSPSQLSADSTTGNETRLLREVCALTLLFIAAFLTLSLSSYHPQDPSFNQQATSVATIHNHAGIIGAYVSGLIVDLFGLAAFVFPVMFVWLAVTSVWRFWQPPWWRWVGLLLLSLSFLAASSHPWVVETVSIAGIHGGGYFGDQLHALGIALLKERGAMLLWLFLVFLASQLLFGLYWTRWGDGLAIWLHRAFQPRPEKVKPPRKSNQDMPTSLLEDFQLSGAKKQPAKKATKSTILSKAGSTDQSKLGPEDKGLPRLPSLDILAAPDRKQPRTSPQRLKEMGKALESCLADFGVQGEVQHIQPGPVITMFEYKPAPGVKISRITGLSDDLSLGLKASSVRVVANLQGKDAVGVEIPNEYRQSVWLREILESDAFQNSKSKLTIAIGKDIEGLPMVADLARMPHLLVAGATGAGKSVGLNSMILSILYKARPDEVKFLLVDPKRIELAVYANLPHLVHPVVTEMSMAKSALDWAMAEMDARYEAMALLGVRHIAAYQQKVAAMPPEEAAEQRAMPYLVIIIDELADLMLTAAKEVEVSIVRLAQLARASGIHMILATQRPSVDVVTGLIKANFPCRISFQVTSKHDSRTILDTVGAEHLLGQGDMLFKPSAGRLQRMHGAFVGDEEIAAVVQAWRDQQPPSFELDFSEWSKEETAKNGVMPEGADVAEDPIYTQAVEFVLEQGRASISLLQRRFRIGFNRSARFIEQMEKDGLLGAQEGSKPRAVIKSKKG
ncbi:DNA segregation ATPase FtsK/SpoIIIE, S-DNA-T family [Desulfonatronum thiosulfatophilum]|uniref:DNA segregation ATPase FtsK/SpoIIIE, S-DNA-T family n=1 Tax=Desulfonatronum thiosulfatophilum TaxID=617002 RepID=A0A1G6DS55_9BACT|nr:DNA segregation ATPase FtsK/SpoIIIE, S-DNA-T family [Desulfonatronum thiosulfatophilum]